MTPLFVSNKTEICSTSNSGSPLLSGIYHLFQPQAHPALSHENMHSGCSDICKGRNECISYEIHFTKYFPRTQLGFLIPNALFTSVSCKKLH